MYKKEGIALEYFDGNLLKKERIKRGISQKDLASSIGVSPRSVINFENGHAPSLLTALKLAAFFDVEVETLFPLSD